MDGAGRNHASWRPPRRLRLGAVTTETPAAPPSVPEDDLVMRRVFGGDRTVSVDLRALPHRAMAADALEVIRASCERGTAYRSPGAITKAVLAVRRFSSFLSEADPHARVVRLADVTPEILAAFAERSTVDGSRKSDVSKHGGKASGPLRRMFSELILLLGRAADLGLAAAEASHAGAMIAAALPRGRDNPREPYPPGVLRDLVKACRTSIFGILCRINEGRRWAKLGGDPENLGWHDACNVTWHLRHKGLEGTERRGAQFSDSWRRRRSEGSPGAASTWKEVLKRTYLTGADMVPFTILIALDSGIPIESVRELNADCLTDATGARAYLRFVKRRRAKDDRLWSEPVEVRRRFSTGWLVRALLLATAVARRQAGYGPTEGPLLLGRDGVRLRRLPVNKTTASRFVEQAGIRDADGKPLRRIALSRLRKSKVERDYVASDGDIRAARQGHSTRTFAHHYSILKATAARHEEAVEGGIRDALSAALPQGANLQAPERTARLADHIGAGDAPTEHAWISGCRDRFDSPYEIAGAPCGAPLWGCLDCVNAVFNESKIPGLLKLLDDVVTRRERMPLPAWRAIYGIPYARIVQVLDSFDQRKVAAAVAEADIGSDWLPNLIFVGKS